MLHSRARRGRGGHRKQKQATAEGIGAKEAFGGLSSIGGACPGMGGLPSFLVRRAAFELHAAVLRCGPHSLEVGTTHASDFQMSLLYCGAAAEGGG